MIQEIEIDKIYFRLFDDKGWDHPTKIENSPVYKAVCGDTEPYTQYHERMVKLGRAKSGYMTTEDFLKFEKQFNYLLPPYENDYVRVKKTGHLYAGWDGAHRISCEKKKGKKTIKAILMDGAFKHKGYSNLIDVATIVNNIGYDDYVIIKDDGMFPNYVDDDDLDFICKDRKVLRDCIIKELDKYKEHNYNIIENNKEVRHHIDVIPEGTNEKNRPYGAIGNKNLINFRFDLLDQSPYLQQFHHQTNKIEIKPNFYDTIIDRKIQKEFKWPIMFQQKGTFKANFPNEVDDLVLRFIEWVWQPHKHRHINYVLTNIKNEHIPVFINTVNNYTNIDIDKDYIKNLKNTWKKKQ